MNELRPEDWIEVVGPKVRCPHCGGRLWTRPADWRVFVRQRPGHSRNPTEVRYATMEHRSCGKVHEFRVEAIAVIVRAV